MWPTTVTLPCLICEAPSRGGRRWRGYYHYRCENGHRWKLATPKQAARNWARKSEATRRAEAS